MAYNLSNPGLVGAQPVNTADTTQNAKIGTRSFGYDPTLGAGEFIYLKGVASTAVGSWVTYDISTGLTTLLAASATGPVAVAMSDCSATTSYGWYQIFGATKGKSSTSIAINTFVYATTAGGVDDAVTDGAMVHNAKCVSTVAGSVTTGTFMLHYPYMDSITTND